MRIYLDASPIIYWVEKVAAYYPQVDARIKQAGVALVSSQLALMECLVLPLRQGQAGLKQDFDDIFATQLNRHPLQPHPSRARASCSRLFGKGREWSFLP
jgi:hypothetical protein